MVHLWPFSGFVTAGRMAVAVSAAYRGPAVITDVMLSFRSGAAPETPMVAIYVSDNGDNQRTNSLDLSRPSGELIFDPFSSASTAPFFPRREGTDFQDNVPREQWLRWPLSYVVQLSRFFIKIAHGSPVAGGDIHSSGFMRIVEGISPGQAADFL